MSIFSHTQTYTYLNKNRETPFASWQGSYSIYMNKAKTNKIQIEYILIIILSIKVLIIKAIHHYVVNFKIIRSFGLILILS